MPGNWPNGPRRSISCEPMVAAARSIWLAGHDEGLLPIRVCLSPSSTSLAIQTLDLGENERAGTDQIVASLAGPESRSAPGPEELGPSCLRIARHAGQSEGCRRLRQLDRGVRDLLEVEDPGCARRQPGRPAGARETAGRGDLDIRAGPRRGRDGGRPGPRLRTVHDEAAAAAAATERGRLDP